MLIPLLIIALLILAFFWMYNTLIARKNDVIRTFSTIDVLMKKRYDLIPNMVEVVKEYMGYENKLLTEVTLLRGAVGKTGDNEAEKFKLDAQITQHLRSIFAVAENYPDLKASQSFISLQQMWKELEDQLVSSRADYNISVTSYNNAVEMFPTNLVATFMDYKVKALFESLPGEREVPDAQVIFRR